VILTIEKHKISLLIDTGASISAIPFPPGPRSSKKSNVQGISGQTLEHILLAHDFNYSCRTSKFLKKSYPWAEI
jgi:hypothetical protein